MLEGLGTKEIIARGQAAVMNTYGRLPMALIKGEGVWVWDADGKRYLDFVTGLAVNSLGHSHPAVVAAIRAQAGEILHTSNLYWIPNQVALAERLVVNSFADKVFFCNSGAEANEAALKLARKYAKKNYGSHKYEIVSLTNSFHGRTLATLTATGQTKYQQGFEPLPAGFSYVPLNDVEALTAAVNDHTAAVLIEPIQGEGGVYPADQAFLQKARELCERFGALLIFDEVQCGMGRTGKLFAYQWSGVTPDIMTLAKALAGGVPVGAMLATDKAAAAFQPGDHASTFGGNPLATAVGCAVLDVMLADGFLAGVQQRAAYFRQGLEKLAAKLIPDRRESQMEPVDAGKEAAKPFGLQNETTIRTSNIEQRTSIFVRGQGMILGLPVGEQGVQIVDACREKGLLINCVGGQTLRFLPPLTVQTAEIDEALAILAEVFTEILG